jgi:arsenate reductase-like glutaredoxin family protein
MGNKQLRRQLFVSRFEAMIFSDYHERRCKLARSPERSMDLEEAQRWMHKSENLALDIARTNQALFESVGLARPTFTQSAELTHLTERIFYFKTPIISPPSDKADQNGLNGRKTQDPGGSHSFASIGARRAATRQGSLIAKSETSSTKRSEAPWRLSSVRISSSGFAP